MTESYVDTPAPGEFDPPVVIEKPKPITVEKLGYTIEFPTPDKARFRVVEQIDKGQWFDSYDKAIEAIKDQIAIDAKASIAGLSSSIAAITEKGQKVTVTGINRANGEVKVSGADFKSYGGTLYADLPWVPEHLAKVAELRVYERALKEVAVSGSRGYGFGRITAHRYPDHLAKLEKDFATAYERGNKDEV